MNLQNPKFISEFQDQLAQHFVEQQQAFEDGLNLSDNRAEQLAHYIISARKERGWARSYCADKADLSQSTLYLLENGLLLVSDAKAEWCHQLAQAFDVDIQQFEEIIGQELPISSTFYQRMQRFNRWAVAFFSSPGRVRIVIGLMLLTLFGWLFNVFYNLYATPSVFASPYLSLSLFNLVQFSAPITAVSIILLIIWLFIWKGELIYQWIQQKKHSISMLAVLSFFVLMIYQFVYLIPYQFKCQFGHLPLFCQSESVIAYTIFLFSIIAFYLALTAILLQFSRRLIRLLHSLPAQRKLVYISLIISFLMPLLFIKSSTVNASMLNATYAQLEQTENQIASFEKPPYQSLTPQNNKDFLINIWLSDQASRLRTQIEWHHELTFFSLIQFSITILLYAFITIAILKKGKFLTSFSKY